MRLALFLQLAGFVFVAAVSGAIRAAKGAHLDTQIDDNQSGKKIFAEMKNITEALEKLFFESKAASAFLADIASKNKRA